MPASQEPTVAAFATLSEAPAAWLPTPPGFAASPLDPRWGDCRPMVLSDGSEFLPPGHPPFSASAGSEFFAAAAQVYEVGRALTAEQKYIADFWADNPGATGHPPGHWIAIVGQTSRNNRLSLMRAAEAFAAVGIAVHDAFIACWHAKYSTNLLRPVTYIRRYIDSVWLSYVATPAFPTYTSGHSTQSGAAAEVLTRLFGARPFTVTTHVDRGTAGSLGARSFQSFREAAAEAMGVMYGGIHYEFDNQDGLEVGQRVGRAVLDRIRFI